VLGDAEQRLGAPETVDLQEHHRAALIALAAGSHVTEADCAHAIANALCNVASATFAPAWRDELRAASAGPVVLPRGAFFPVACSPWKRGGLAPSSLPERLSRTGTGEMPTIRVHDGSFRVTVDVSLERWLENISERLTGAAAAHPNVHWGEISMPAKNGFVFPVAPVDTDAQLTRIKTLIEQAQAANMPVVVLPELSVTEDLIARLATTVEDFDGEQLVIAGSYHAKVGGKPENVAVGLIAGTQKRMIQVKNRPFTRGRRRGEPPMKEAIHEREPIELTIYPADLYRYAIGICLDVLDRGMQAVYARMGVNVLLVPALSEKTDPFRKAVSVLVAGAQTLTVVVNGPLHGPDGEPISPAIVVGQPVVGPDRAEPPTNGAVGLTVFSLPAR
jgi:hypothetical protein